MKLKIFKIAGAKSKILKNFFDRIFFDFLYSFFWIRANEFEIRSKSLHPSVREYMQYALIYKPNLSRKRSINKIHVTNNPHL